MNRANPYNKQRLRSMSLAIGALTTLTLLLTAGAAGADEAKPAVGSRSPQDATSSGVRFLIAEVPAWSRENRCYSCHNNGDAARALYQAGRAGFKTPGDATSDTTRWLLKPAGWQRNGGDAEFSDPRLMVVQFASALLETFVPEQHRESRQEAIRSAAALVASQQSAHGSWPIDAPGTIGSPATYGTLLATVSAWRVLNAAQTKELRTPIARAEQWLSQYQPKNVFDAAVLLWWHAEQADPNNEQRRAQREACWELIRQGESPQGGWGPYVNSRPEPFDTAIVLLALAAQPRDETTHKWLERGRAYLAQSQFDDGSWPESTRPAGGESYAQRLSTTAWAVQALLASERRPSVEP